MGPADGLDRRVVSGGAAVRRVRFRWLADGFTANVWDIVDDGRRCS